MGRSEEWRRGGVAAMPSPTRAGGASVGGRASAGRGSPGAPAAAHLVAVVVIEDRRAVRRLEVLVVRVHLRLRW